MPSTSDETFDFTVRNQVMLERLKAGEHKKFAPFLKDIEKSVRIRLSDEGETIRNKNRLNSLLTDVTAIQRQIYNEYQAQLVGDLSAIGVQQAAFEAASYNAAVVGFQSSIPAEAQILAAIRVNPLQVANYAGNPLLEPFIKDWSSSEIHRVRTAIQQGFYQGQTNAEITRNLRGTRANNFNDGDYTRVNRSNRTLVRTAVQHSSTQARVITMSQNSDLVASYEWVSTLDSRTSNQCASLDGRNFKMGEGPLPPIHPNCRSTITPVLSSKFDFLDEGATRPERGSSGTGQTNADTTYYSWLKRQPAKFQNEAIGPTRGALLRNGGITSDEFAKLSLNKNFEPLTLDQMRAKSPSVFERAGL